MSGEISRFGQEEDAKLFREELYAELIHTISILSYCTRTTITHKAEK